MGDYQHPPEVLENAGNVQNRVNMGQTTGDVFHFESTMGGPTRHAGTNGANERK